MTQPYRPRRTCLAVPGSSPRFLEKARGLAVDEVFLDLEDAVAPAAKAGRPARGGRGAERGRLGEQDPRGADQRRGHPMGLPGRDRGGRGGRGQPGRDRAAQGRRAGPRPLAGPAARPDRAGHRPGSRAGSASRRRSRTPAGWPRWTTSRPRPAGWRRWCSARLTSWPASACARCRWAPSRTGYTGGDAYHYPRLRILVAARSRGLAAIDGPHLAIHDIDGLRRGAASAAALGYDGKWVLHPGQVDVVNQAFSPDQDQLRAGRADPGRLCGGHRCAAPRRGHARRRDDRRGVAQAGHGHRGQGPRGRAGPRRRAGPGSAEHAPAGQRLGQPAGQR